MKNPGRGLTSGIPSRLQNVRRLSFVFDSIADYEQDERLPEGEHVLAVRSVFASRGAPPL
jgi:hypothetical protein